MTVLSGRQQIGLLGLVVAAGFAVVAMPRALAPLELPALSLRPDWVQAQERADTQLAAAAPSTPAAGELLAAVQRYGQREVLLFDNARLLGSYRHELHGAYERVRTESGAHAVLALRALAVSKLEAALEGKLQGEALQAWLGVFPNVLIQHLATRDGLELAPHFVVRTLYKARWNRMLDLSSETDLSVVERQAYFGWLGLHAYTLPMFERRQALSGYAAAGGEHAAEAQGVLAFLDHDFGAAVQCLEQAYAQRPSFRVRNYLRGARAVAEESGQSAKLSHEAQSLAHD